MSETLSPRRTYWFQTKVDAHSVTFLHAATVEIQYFQTRCEAPDMHESGLSELTSPLSSDTDTATGCSDDVAELFPAVEAGVG